MGIPSRLCIAEVGEQKRRAPIHVTHLASGDLWAGAEVQLFHVAKQLAEQPGLSIDVVLLNRGELERRLRETGIAVTVLDETKLTSLALLKSIIRHVKRVRPDVIHSHRRKENFLAAIARPFAGNCVSVSTVHGLVGTPSWFRFDQRTFNLVNRLILRFVQQRCIAVSGELGGRLRSGLGKRVEVIENGIDIDHIVDASKLRHGLPEANGRIRVGIVARLVHCKRIDLAIETAACLKESCPDRFEFFVFGDGPLKEAVQQQIRERGLMGTVHLSGFQHNLPAALRQMDAMLMPSDHEGLPMALLEAMALGVPVVAHAVGGIPNALRQGRAGWLVSKQQPESYAEALQSMAFDPEPFRERAKRARAALEESYSSRKTALEYAALYRGLRTTGPNENRL